MKKVIGLALVAAAVATMAGYATTSEKVEKVKPDVAMKWLEDGNKRFVSGKSIHPHQSADWRKETAEKGQHPYATIISCADSRVPVEVLFDEGIGELFVVRVAGNVCDVDEIGTTEYGVDHLGTQLVVVLGHSKCGAVTAVATDAPVHGNVAKLVDNIQPAVEQAKKTHPELKGKDLVPAAVEANVWQAIEDLLKNSELIRADVKVGAVKVVGGIYDLETGSVKWLGTHPRQEDLLKTPVKEEAKKPSHAEEKAAVEEKESAHEPKAHGH